MSKIRQAIAIPCVGFAQQIQRHSVLLEQDGATRDGSIAPMLLKSMVGPCGLEPQTSTVSRNSRSRRTRLFHRSQNLTRRKTRTLYEQREGCTPRENSNQSQRVCHSPCNKGKSFARVLAIVECGRSGVAKPEVSVRVGWGCLTPRSVPWPS